ncbi:MAG: hypothetical protein NUV61_00180 [Candidatus Azambacteria bacterium]|nr:hypothetical protein [Candidatus Azambacteria bacterium]
MDLIFAEAQQCVRFLSQKEGFNTVRVKLRGDEGFSKKAVCGVTTPWDHP